MQNSFSKLISEITDWKSAFQYHEHLVRIFIQISFSVVLLIWITNCDKVVKSKNTNNEPAKIIFCGNYINENSEIFAVNDDGTDFTQLTTIGRCEYPSFSNDGEKIVFSSFNNGTSNDPAIWIMNSNGCNLEQLNNKNLSQGICGRNPNFNYSDNQVLYYAYSNWGKRDVYLYDLKNQNVRQITTDNFDNVYPIWNSCDTNKIAYLSSDSLFFETDLFLFDLNTSKIERLTHSGYIGFPIWDSSGKFLFFRYSGENAGIYKINIISKDIELVLMDINEGEFKIAPQAISKDNSQLLFIAHNINDKTIKKIMILDLISNELRTVETNSYEIELSGFADWNK